MMNQPPIPTPEYMVVTPRLATEWVARNHPQNRLASISAVNAIRDKIIAGTFKNDEATIKFSPKGHLIDGQHRLCGIIAAGKPVGLYVLRDVDLTLSVDWWAIRASEE